MASCTSSRHAGGSAFRRNPCPETPCCNHVRFGHGFRSDCRHKRCGRRLASGPLSRQCCPILEDPGSKACARTTVEQACTAPLWRACWLGAREAVPFRPLALRARGLRAWRVPFVLRPDVPSRAPCWRTPSSDVHSWRLCLVIVAKLDVALVKICKGELSFALAPRPCNLRAMHGHLATASPCAFFAEGRCALTRRTFLCGASFARFVEAQGLRWSGL